MKKTIYTFIALSILSLSYLLIWTGVQSHQGKTIRLYPRFITEEGFNWKGIFSPIQVESQTLENDTQNFSIKVYYPLSKDFSVVPPVGSPEHGVAKKIKKAIEDTLAKRNIEYSFDYDGSSRSVREHYQPETLEPQKIRVGLHCFGTASPEAGKYGFKESVQPGHFEEENAQLAKDRLFRTAYILDTMGYKSDSLSSQELQFTDTLLANKAVKDRGMLDSMRYVQANVTISSQQVFVKTKTMPWLLPLWLLLGLLALSFLRKRNRKRIRVRNIAENILLLLIAIMYLIATAILLVLLSPFISWLAIILVTLIFFGLLWLILKNLRHIAGYLFKFFTGIFVWLYSLWISFILFLRRIGTFFHRLWRRFLICWNYLTPCWKRVFVWMCIIIVILVATIIHLL